MDDRDMSGLRNNLTHSEDEVIEALVIDALQCLLHGQGEFH